MSKTLDFIDFACKNKAMIEKFNTLGHYIIQTDVKAELDDSDIILDLDLLHQEWDMTYARWLNDKGNKKLQLKLNSLYDQEFKLAKKAYAEIFNLQEKGDK